MIHGAIDLPRADTEFVDQPGQHLADFGPLPTPRKSTEDVIWLILHLTGKSALSRKSPPRLRDACMFCRTNTNVLSEEHIIPKWSKKAFPAPAHSQRVDVATHFEHDRWVNGLNTARPRYRQDFNLRQGLVRTVRYRRPCKACNSIWMSQMENNLKHLLTKLVCGEPHELSDDEQIQLATWVAMKAMVVDFREGEANAAIAPEDRAIMFTSRRPPPHWSVWIGRSHVSAGVNSFDSGKNLTLPAGPDGRRASSSQAEAERSYNTQCFTLVMGQLLLYCISSQAFDMSSAAFSGSFQRLLAKIWPSQTHLVWPPALRMSSVKDLDDLQTLMATFGRQQTSIA